MEIGLWATTFPHGARCPLQAKCRGAPAALSFWAL